MIKEIGIQGCITVPEDVSMDEVIDKFIAFVEENNWSFGGGYKTIIDGYYMNDDGTRGKYVLDEQTGLTAKAKYSSNIFVAWEARSRRPLTYMA